LFAAAVVAALLLFSWLQLQIFKSGLGTNLSLVVVPPLAALSIILALWPRFRTWHDPGRGLTEKRAPELFAMLRELSRATRQPMPRRVYLTQDINAGTARRGLGTGTALFIGLPLFELLSVDELRAIVAHEFGHFSSRVGLSTFVYQTVVTFAGATEAASLVPGLDVVFELWAEVFLRIGMPISRQQELRADDLGVRVSGAEAFASALRKLAGASSWNEIYEPVPGWEQDLHETHPPLHHRIKLARQSDVVSVLPPEERSARILLQTLLVESAPDGGHAGGS
jgi:Zn-dependent protease with chaperone function